MTLFQTHDYLFQNSVIETSICKRFEHMETDPPPPKPEDLEKCSRILDTFECLIIKKSRLAANQHLLDTMDSGIIRINHDNYSMIVKEIRKLTEEIEELQGELTSIGFCPIEDCQYHSKLNAPKVAQKLKDSSKKLELDLKKVDTNTSVDNPPSNPLKKKNRLDGFTAPTKVTKKQKVLQNYSFGAAAPIPTSNKYQTLSGNDDSPTQSNEAMPVATPKIPPIHLKFEANYNLIMQEINRKYPKTSSKLSGEYLRIFAASMEERNEIIDFLKGKGEQFFALHPQDVKTQKIVIKGLPISADIDDIKQDLSEQGFLVSKVAQLTKNKSKFKLPIFMVELQKSPDSPDIFKLEKCCYLTVKIDTFNRRPGPTQCYNCNLFNHSSKNCHIKTRCLKCGDPHKTGDCPIKDLIENPVCINCNKTGHLANSHRCEKYPKIQPKKGSPLNRNKPQNSFNSDQSKVKNDISFANALKGNQQMAPLPENPVPLNEPETAPAPQEKKKSK
ncbi:nucleic-acid-binding protein from transposon X-element [Trichonephila clavipes]|nr:nucleic-acid-binding protein from transposon X-element [Trichonephila clavipes]